jgi:hypothetical protein
MVTNRRAAQSNLVEELIEIDEYFRGHRRRFTTASPPV